MRPSSPLTDGLGPKRLAKSPGVGVGERPVGRRRDVAVRCGSRCGHGRLQLFVADIGVTRQVATRKCFTTASAHRKLRSPRQAPRAWSSQHFGERLQEARVLLGRAVGDAQRALAPERAAAAHEHAALRAGRASPRPRRAPRRARTSRSWPATRRARARARAAARPPRSRSAIVRVTRSVTASWWASASTAAACASALQKNGWRTWSTARGSSSEPHSAKPTRSPHRP